MRTTWQSKTWGKGQVRFPRMKTRRLKMKRETTGGENGLAESPDEKAGVGVKLGSSRKKREKTGPGNFLQKYLWG